MFNKDGLIRCQHHDKPGTGGVGGVEGDVTMHVTGKGTGDGEADASAIRVFVELNELGEDILGLVRGDANAGIFDDKEGLAAMNAEAQRDGGTVGLAPLVSQGMGELDGIVEQEGEGLDG